MGLIMAGMLAHTGDLDLFWAIIIAGLGGFAGDQIYFHIGKYNKKYVHKKLKKQRRKFALAHLLLKKYGWPIIFVQRYMYGLRTIIPISIGLTSYNSKKFAFINLISAMVWSSITILLAWYFGEALIHTLAIIKSYWYLTVPLLLLFLGSIMWYFNKHTKKDIKNENRT